MAAMEACLAARRVIAASPEPPKTAAEMMAEQMKAAVAAPPTVGSTGPAAGNGKEILLQVRAAQTVFHRQRGLLCGSYRAPGIQQWYLVLINMARCGSRTAGGCIYGSDCFLC